MPFIKNLPSLVSLLECCSTTKNLQTLQILHAGAIKLGFSTHDFARAKLASAYAACSQIDAAHSLFSVCNRRSTFLYNTLIRGYSSLKKFHLSLSIFSEMLAARKLPDSNTLPAVLKSVGGLSSLSLGRRVHVSVLAHGFGSDPANCSALITMYAKCGDLISARKVFDEMPVRNAISWTALIGAYGMHGRIVEVCDLFERMIEAGIRPDEVAFTAVLDACGHGGFVEKGREYFEMMRGRFGISPNVVHFTCLVDMFARAGRIEEAKGVIERMDVEPDEVLVRALYGPYKVS